MPAGRKSCGRCAFEGDALDPVGNDGASAVSTDAPLYPEVNRVTGQEGRRGHGVILRELMALSPVIFQ